MRARIRDEMRREIEEIIYRRWLEELLERAGIQEDMEGTARRATAIRMHMLERAWVTVDFLPSEIYAKLTQADDAFQAKENPPWGDRYGLVN